MQIDGTIFTQFLKVSEGMLIIMLLVFPDLSLQSKCANRKNNFSPAENAIAYITCGCSVLGGEYESMIATARFEGEYL